MKQIKRADRVTFMQEEGSKRNSKTGSAMGEVAANLCIHELSKGLV